MSWVSGERLIRLSVGLFVTTLLARYLGPETFGIYSLGLAIIALYMPFAELGLQGVMLKSLVQAPQRANSLTGTAFAMRLFGGVLVMLLSILSAYSMSEARPELPIIVTLLSLSALFRSTESFKYAFEAEVRVKPIVLVEGASSLITNFTKIAAIALGASVIAIAAIHTTEFLLSSIGILIVYSRCKHPIRSIQANAAEAKELLKRSWPLLLSTLAVTIYMKIDQLMLGAMMGDKHVGIYAVAARISEVWYFIPAAAICSTFPILIKTKEEDKSLYIRRLIRLYRSMIFLAAIVGLIFTFGSEFGIKLLFGSDYTEAAPVLSLHAWSGLFAVQGMITGYWLINEDLERHVLVRTASGAAINILLNLLLIPAYGISGAALATLLSQSWTGLWIDLFSKKTRVSFLYKLRALTFWRAA